ncbi:SDR family NAD(P)-dependent oxidoreductase [Campylobacter sp. MIT 97-5078]|uniref:SDR family NAD(P)-dependent oxidoreductase n=1 Tax=Campylobacter sp. MIT 97-5078 TaxID=1548153 RepID=UPI000513CACB|nr:SDR family NAD(P)-dependent oxidoreductase [Campylobacter sp. MIT 97-5078]KGI55950.1 hypothetical protein LR59_09745 [Campylobacter sp. MIT 97-5078]TQR27821.1 SDR family oxidoreductase [Campylobacter sp. MIT 97-5078]
MQTYTNAAITGASSGIGIELALLLAQEKTTLFLNARDETRLKKVQAKAQEFGSKAFVYAFDVCDEKACKAWCEELFKEPLDLLILNAGISSGDDESEQKQIQIAKTNVLGITNLIFYTINAMQKQEFKGKFKGQIVLVSSIASLLALPNAPTYSASKHFVTALCEALSLAHPEICFTCICPGFIKTNLTKHLKLKMMEANAASFQILNAIKAKKKKFIFPFHIALIAKLYAFLPFFIKRYFVRFLQKRAKL